MAIVSFCFREGEHSWQSRKRIGAPFRFEKLLAELFFREQRERREEEMKEEEGGRRKE
jgi:hypothetical protein